jgi:uncharacterized membrane protein
LQVEKIISQAQTRIIAMLKAQNKNIKHKLNYQNIKLLKDKEKKRNYY